MYSVVEMMLILANLVLIDQHRDSIQRTYWVAILTPMEGWGRGRAWSVYCLKTGSTKYQWGAWQFWSKTARSASQFPGLHLRPKTMTKKNKMYLCRHSAALVSRLLLGLGGLTADPVIAIPNPSPTPFVYWKTGGGRWIEAWEMRIGEAYGWLGFATEDWAGSQCVWVC